ncbi:3'(2'),5'-bisphosphate nucleotidase CysQ [Saccharophagus degradans]|uniref:3'(2'),5'-bisphosphate nucleotidase CysQ n=1 Tax=Saccharophagus degradans (strain 2-40 / ATCC 43961 / DSM 17024) TaxID=203122 RepID=Q21EK2_SACD2|nr:3'(2'),5'-bisphosphate nucleotidase CysQ [Saccharophagus degradans]ABD82877.1 3'(2'),5'-bisphosphate nucleotidase [Saccharophagus degradans 2-40]
MNLATLLPSIEQLAKQAGEATLAVYKKPELWDVEHKDDCSPLTQADIQSHNIIAEGLAALTPNIPVLSEEDDVPSFEVRSQWQQYWLIDPLDGTKEFINRKGEFTVNIALIQNNKAVLGVVYAPVLDVCYTGAEGIGAFKIDAKGKTPLRVKKLTQGKQTLNIVASRRHGAEEVDRLLETITSKYGEPQLTSMGSSLKLCLVAEGKADIYPRLAPTCEWDTAASQAVVEQAGGVVLDDQFKPMQYNAKPELLNGYFYVIGDQQFDWLALLK